VAYFADSTLYSIATFWLWPCGFSFAMLGIMTMRLCSHVLLSSDCLWEFELEKAVNIFSVGILNIQRIVLEISGSFPKVSLKRLMRKQAMCFSCSQQV